MTTIKTALEIIDKFIGIGKQLAKLPALVLPQYQVAAQDLYTICQKLLSANENLSRWLHRFLYFDFRGSDARQKFLTAIQEYKSMKSGVGFQQLKFSCRDISGIYYRDISSKLGGWFSNQQKLEETAGIFAALIDTDNEMTAFVYDHVVTKLDDFVTKAEQHVNAAAFDAAEEARLQFKADSREVTERLEKFSGELADLVITFAQIARVPVTLGTS